MYNNNYPQQPNRNGRPAVPMVSNAQAAPNAAQMLSNLGVPTPQRNNQVPAPYVAPPQPQHRNTNAGPSNYMGVPTPNKAPSVPNPQRNYMGVPTPIKTPAVPTPQNMQQPNYGGGPNANPVPNRNNQQYNQQPNYSGGQNPQYNQQQPNNNRGQNQQYNQQQPNNNPPATNPAYTVQPTPVNNPTASAPVYTEQATPASNPTNPITSSFISKIDEPTMAVAILEGMTPGKVMNVQIFPGEDPKEVTVPEYAEWKSNERNEPYFTIPMPARPTSMKVPIPPGIAPGNVVKVQFFASETPKDVTVPAYQEWKSNEKKEPYFTIPIPQAANQAAAAPVVQATFNHR